MSQTLDNAKDYLVIGAVSGVYGLQGWVRIKSFTQPPAGFIAYDDCYLFSAGAWKSVTIEKGREQGKDLVVKFAHVSDRDAAEALRSSEIAIKRSSLPELAAGDGISGVVRSHF